LSDDLLTITAPVKLSWPKTILFSSQQGDRSHQPVVCQIRVGLNRERANQKGRWGRLVKVARAREVRR